MKIFGMIAEFNPLHLGHQYLLNETRKCEADAVVCAMSGNYVQRGDVSVVSKFARSKMAVECGADLVIELPTPWAMANAQVFARGGIEILKMAGCTHLICGSECGSTEQIQEIQEILERENVQNDILQNLKTGCSYPRAQELALRKVDDNLANLAVAPNNILLLEYLKAIKESRASILPHTVARIGAPHDSLQEDKVVSASFLREQLRKHRDIASFVSPNVQSILTEETMHGRAPVALNEGAVLSALRKMKEEDLACYADSGEGLHHRFYEAIRNAATVEDILQQTKTKRYPMARIRRMLLSAYLEIPGVPASIPYARILACNETGRIVLKQMKEKEVPVLTKPADIGKLGKQAEELFTRETIYTDLYTLGYPDQTQSVPGIDWRFSPILI